MDRALISGVAEANILEVKREKISEAVKRSVELYGNQPSFLADIIRLAIRALELLISKVLLAAAKVAERIVDAVHDKVEKKEIQLAKDEPELDIKIEEPEKEPVQLPKKPEKPALLSKYPLIMELDTELKRRNDEIFAVEQERSNLEIELSECTGVFKQKRRKELQERITLLDRKAEKMKSELSKVLRESGYANAAEFYTELFVVREEKRKYEEACKVWQEECIQVELKAMRDSRYYGGNADI